MVRGHCAWYIVYVMERFPTSSHSEKSPDSAVLNKREKRVQEKLEDALSNKEIWKDEAAVLNNMLTLIHDEHDRYILQYLPSLQEKAPKSGVMKVIQKFTGTKRENYVDFKKVQLQFRLENALKDIITSGNVPAFKVFMQTFAQPLKQSSSFEGLLDPEKFRNIADVHSNELSPEMKEAIELDKKSSKQKIQERTGRTEEYQRTTDKGPSDLEIAASAIITGVSAGIIANELGKKLEESKEESDASASDATASEDGESSKADTSEEF